MGLFVTLMAVGYLLLTRNIGLWRNISASEDASLGIKKAHRMVEHDLLQCNFNDMNTAIVPPSLASGGDGTAVWCLSAAGPTGATLMAPDGSAFWQRNILYYLVVPAGHTSCAGGSGPGNLDDRCPHKVLIRKVIDSGTPTSPASDPIADREALLTGGAITAYLTRPNGFDVSAMMGEPGVTQVEIVANNLLWFETKREPDPDIPKEIQVDIRAVRNEELQTLQSIGSAPLYDSPGVTTHLFSVFPRN